MKKVFAIILVVVIGVLAFDFAQAYQAVQKGKILAAETVPFERIIPDAPMRILVVGDSSAFGTGATEPIYSTAGYLGEKYKEAEVINISENGLKLEGLLHKLDDRELAEFDIAVAQIGANDIIQLTNLENAKDSLRLILETLSGSADKVVILHSANLGAAPIFPKYIGFIFTKRSSNFREIYKTEVAEFENVSYVDLFIDDKDRLDELNLPKYYARDGLHLSDEGYFYWYEKIQMAIDKI